MKIGVGVIAYSGMEILKPCLQNVRRFAHYIVVVYSKESHSGHPSPAYMKPLLDDLCAEGLIDELCEYNTSVTNDPLEMQINCMLKRERARCLCLAAGCDFYHIRDCDEFYDDEDFEAALPWMTSHDACICRTVDYIKSPKYMRRAVNVLYVPCMQSIRFPLAINNPFLPKIVDRGRSPFGVRRTKRLNVSVLVMHHMTAVRLNDAEYIRKYEGHGGLNRRSSLGDYIDGVNSIDIDEEIRKGRIVKVADRFGILKYWQEFRERWVYA